MSPDACGAWAPGDCEGTPHCPVRCPRFVDREGRPYLLLSLGDRAGVEAERAALAAMYDDFGESSRSMGLPPREDAAVREWVRNLAVRGENVLAWDGDSVVGHAGFAPADEPEPEFLVYVHGDYHTRGLGGELIRQAVARAAAADREALTLHVDADNDPAVGLFRSLGFETVADHAMELEMRLPLSDPIADRVRLAPAARA
jgi:GNAT superfamily N-acetyltransferase